MKQMLRVIMILAILSGFSQAQTWEIIKEGQMEYIPSACSFLNAETGLYLSSGGVVIMTTDGTNSFQTVREADGSDLKWEDVEFYNDTLVVSCGDQGIIYKSADGGYSWTQIGDTINYRWDLKSIDVVTDKIFYVAGIDSTLLKTIDGGMNWTKINYGFDQEDLDGGLAFLNPDSGVVITNANNGKTWYTHDGGINWSLVQVEFPLGTISKKLYDVATNEASTIAIAGHHYCLFISNDAGQTYSQVGSYSIDFKNLFQVEFCNDNLITASGMNGYIIKTEPDGENWNNINIPTGNHADIMDFTDEQTGYVFAGNGQWFKTGDGGNSWTPILEWPNIHIEGLAVPSVNKIVTGGWGGAMSISDDGGFYFPYPDNSLSKCVNSISNMSFYDDKNGLAGSYVGELYRTADGGINWTKIENPMADVKKKINDIYYVTDQILFAGGTSGNIIKSENGGLSWVSVPKSGLGINEVYAFMAVSDSQVIACAKGMILLSTTQLDSFYLVKKYSSIQMRGIDIKGENILVAASDGKIYRTTTSRLDTLIEVFSEPEGDSFNGVAWANDSTACVVGANGKIYASTDSGQTWQADNMPVENTLYRIRYDGYNYWATGQYGTILKKSIAPADPVAGLFINEFMADNESTISDHTGSFSDWIEIYNSNNYAVNISGFYLTDKLNNLTKYQIPDSAPDSTLIPPDGYLLLWADDSPESGVLHLKFGLSKNGEAIGLTDRDGITVIDSISFGPQLPDTSQGRITDGSQTWEFFYPSSPGDDNENGVVVSISYDNNPVATHYELSQNYPNPFNPTTSIGFSIINNGKVLLEVYDITGQKVATLCNQFMKAGKAKISWNASGLASGLYFYKITAGDFSAVKKMMLLK
ncbi:MAG: lamin tail domain-containing protein [Calditrichaceae bacterium]|nr:lamin tail domain-containing protein [Calditrichaceae bacterium]MBN2708388.1 lamin tail domain-containing protein [Calditrichaceae bacterium]